MESDLGPNKNTICHTFHCFGCLETNVLMNSIQFGPSEFWHVPESDKFWKLIEHESNTFSSPYKWRPFNSAFTFLKWIDSMGISNELWSDTYSSGTIVSNLFSFGFFSRWSFYEQSNALSRLLPSFCRVHNFIATKNRKMLEAVSQTVCENDFIMLLNWQVMKSVPFEVSHNSYHTPEIIYQNCIFAYLAHLNWLMHFVYALQ